MAKKNPEIYEGKPILVAANSEKLAEAVEKFKADYPDIPLESPYVVFVKGKKIKTEAFYENLSIGVVILHTNVEVIGTDSFDGCSNLTSIVIPDSVKEIGSNAFWDCTGLTSVAIPDSVTNIGDYAFRGCSGFTGSLTIGNSVTSIGDYAFNDCKGFTGSLVIPDSVTSIGDGAFGGCFKVDGIVMTSVPQIGSGAFSDVGASKTVVLSENSYVYKEANEYFPEDASVTAPCTLDLTGSAVENHGNLEIVHGEDVYDPEKEPTCTTEGLTEGVHCEICSKVLVEQETIAALGHSYTSEIATEPYIKDTATCTADAVYFHKCSRCDEKGSTTWTKTGTALGHAWGEYHLDGDQTCTNDGHKTAECTREGCSEKNKIVATGAALGHAWGEYILEGDQTCEEDGHKTAMCTREGCTVTNTIEATGAALGHDYTSETATAPYLKSKATCIADAVYFHKCSRCESKGATTWTKEGSALGHEWGEYHLDGDQTCTYDGHKTAECTREGCSEENKIVAAGAALGHDWEDYFTTDIAATCTEAGSESRHCARCSATTDVAPIVAHGHSFTDYISNGDATTEADGTKTAVCDHGCGETDTVIDEGSRIVETPTGITNVESGHSHKAVKTIENGGVVIIRDGVKYDITGRRL